MSERLLERTRTAAEVTVGERLDGLSIPVTTTFVVSTALATRDFQDVHHDRDRARSNGSTDIFLNILTSTGLVQRFVTDWAGPEALVREISLRLGAPCYPGSELELGGEVVDLVREGSGGDQRLRHVVRVRGSTDIGDHVVARVVVELPEG